MRAVDRLLEIAELAEFHHARWGTDRSARLWSEAIHAVAAARTPAQRIEVAS